MKFFPFLISFLTLSFAVNAQRGIHGARTISVPNTIINEYTSLTANAAAGSSILTVVSSSLNSNGRFPASLAAGDLVMIIQIQGVSVSGSLSGTVGTPNDSTWGTITSYNNCGNYEFAQVNSVPNSTTIIIDCGLTKDYTAAGKVQVVRVPRYTTLTVNSGGVLTCDSWNGTTGGILVAEVEQNTVINSGGLIDAGGKGFRGGTLVENNSGWSVWNFAAQSDSYGAEKGESVFGFQSDYDLIGGRYGKGAPANGGGGGNAHNAGGGGGANGGNPSSWNGHGIADVSVAGYATAWELEFAGKSTLVSTGGGKGGYTFSSSNQNATTTGPYTTPWSGDYRSPQGGFGGRPLDYSTGRIFLGGGGGAGDQNDGVGGAGGAGGGLVFLMNYGTVSGGGSIRSNGANGITATGPAPISGWGGKDAGGGGGAGGTIIINSAGTISGITLNADGGNGGNQVLTRGSFYFGSVNEAEGPGAGGGGGYIALSNTGVTQTANGGNNGTTNSDALTEFPPNGATKGAVGTTGAAVTNYTVSASTVSICSGNTATLTANINGSLPGGAIVTWYSSQTGGSPVGTGNSFTTPVLSATTTYYVSTCPGTYRDPVVVTVTPGLTATAGTDATICAGGSVQLNASGGTTYSWSPATGLSNSSVSNPIASPAVTTTYVVTVSNGGGCTGSDTVTVTVGSSLPVSAGTDVTLCQGSSATLNASGGTSYSWSPVTGLSSAVISNPVASPASTTTYIVTVTSGGCSSTDTVIVSVNNLPSVSAGNDASVCSGNSVQLNATGGVSYSWSPGTTLDNPAVANPFASPVSTITYIVTATDNNNCSNSDSVTITVFPAASADAGNNSSMCPGGNVQLNANGGSTFSWTPSSGLNNPNIPNPVASPSSTTTYYVTTVDGNGCSATDSVTITVSGVLAVNAGNDLSLCYGDSVQLNSTGGVTFSWSPSAGLSASNISSPVAFPSSSTTYILTSVDNSGCSGTDTITINVSSPILLSASSDTTICPGQVITLEATASGGTGPYTYSWNNGLSGPGPHSVSPSASTSYSVYSSDASGCVSSYDTITVTLFPSLSLQVSATQNSICAGDCVMLSANGSGGNGGPYSYSWNQGSGGQVCPTVSTTYVVSLSDNCSQVITDSVIINVGTAPTVSVTSSVNSGCAPLCGTFSSSGSGNCLSVLWDFGDGTLDSLNSNPVHCFNGSGNFNVTVQCTDVNGCTGTSVPVTVTVDPQPVADFTPGSTVVLPGQQVCFTNTSTGATVYSWDPGDLSSPQFSNDLCHTYSDTGSYMISLIAGNAGGCFDTAFITVLVIGEIRVLVPNVFTPNSDGNNDLFFVDGKGLKEVNYRIFDRWGILMFESKNTPQGSWDGRTTSGNPAPEGVYYYVLDLITALDEVRTEKGFVQLLRNR